MKNLHERMYFHVEHVPIHIATKVDPLKSYLKTNHKSQPACPTHPVKSPIISTRCSQPTKPTTIKYYSYI